MYDKRAQDYTPWAASSFHRPWALQAASHGGKIQGHVPWQQVTGSWVLQASSYGGKITHPGQQV